MHKQSQPPYGDGKNVVKNGNKKGNKRVSGEWAIKKEKQEYEKEGDEKGRKGCEKNEW